MTDFLILLRDTDHDGASTARAYAIDQLPSLNRWNCAAWTIQGACAISGGNRSRVRHFAGFVVRSRASEPGADRTGSGSVGNDGIEVVGACDLGEVTVG